MDKHFGGIGVCIRCGDLQGPWTWFEEIGWLCDECAEKEEQDESRKLQL